MEARMELLFRQRRSAQIQRPVPPLCSSLQAELPRRYPCLSALLFQALGAKPKSVVIKVENR